MQQERKTLSMRLDKADTPDAASWLIREAMTRGLCISATYNRTPMTMAPHIVYTRHGDPFVDAVVVEGGGKPPHELKLGTFKLAGMTGLKLTAHAFTPFPEFDAADPKYAGAIVATISA